MYEKRRLHNRRGQMFLTPIIQLPVSSKDTWLHVCSAAVFCYFAGVFFVFFLTHDRASFFGSGVSAWLFTVLLVSFGSSLKDASLLRRGRRAAVGLAQLQSSCGGVSPVCWVTWG